MLSLFYLVLGNLPISIRQCPGCMTVSHAVLCKTLRHVYAFTLSVCFLCRESEYIFFLTIFYFFIFFYTDFAQGLVAASGRALSSGQRAAELSQQELWTWLQATGRRPHQ